MKEYWKVGELATLTGLTIRTLRYYDQIQLFSPSQYTESGHRLYTKPDLTNLQQILSLKQIGLSLDDIQAVIMNKEKNAATDIIETQIDRIKGDIQVQQKLLYELESALKTVRSKRVMSVEELTKLLGAMKMNQEKYFTKQQLDIMKSYYVQADEDTIKEVEQEFKVILKEIRLEKEKGTSPKNSKVQELAKKWSNIVYSFTGSDPDIQKQAEKFHAENPGNELQHGVDHQIYRYIEAALQDN
ncbi:DNA-binding transcriptional MerR regulator [Virgibacillus natechei]|uniref:DNA-binding transcriptional MerR regulator n=1 Tax=Virgibacillus natechei TaxID=1216297 RepID=A0ABS4IBS8_9BACI|nr:MerR family transcriptional regulator [Virgibacillus natechei]MBP1968355.1 DNA-binding transcriptional MerR regulator [Virgibacillus natechei]UZD13486.1 MerR family transcriptional regulator [Virgibacillus natechei]